MAGSIDLNTNKGVVLILGASVLAGGGASALQNQLFGPGGQWETVVANQAVLTEQMKNTVKQVEGLTTVIKEGFDKVATSQDNRTEQMTQLTRSVDANAREIEANKERFGHLQQEINRLERLIQ